MKWTVCAASREWGVDRKSLAKWLTMIGFDVKPGSKFHTKDISRAIVGDLDFERTRRERAEASIKELELAQKKSELVPLPEVARLYIDAPQPVRQMILALPAECCSRANPTDPAHSRQALQTWVDSRALPSVREQLPKRMEEKK